MSVRNPAGSIPDNDNLFASRSSAGARLKRCFDVSSATLALLFLSVLFLLIAAAIVLTDGRPVIIRHRRLGRNGTSFSCLKFRTMVVNADEVLQRHLAVNPEVSDEWQRTRKLKSDPRVTPLGAVLRKTSIDELPQLVNVIRGEMSIVGPRPIVTDEVPKYRQFISEYFAVRPGLTGLWQVSGRNDVSYDERVSLDRDYVHGWSFSRDLKIILMTVPAVFKCRGVY